MDHKTQNLFPLTTILFCGHFQIKFVSPNVILLSNITRVGSKKSSTDHLKVFGKPLFWKRIINRMWQRSLKYDVFNVIFSLFQPTGISEEVFRQIETVQNRYDSSTAEAFRAVQKSGEMVVRTLDPRQFIRLASETAQKINIDTNVSCHVNQLSPFSFFLSRL